MKHSQTRLFSLVGIMIFILASLIVFVYMIKPAYQEAQALKAKKIGLENFYDAQKSKIDQLKKVIAAYKGNNNPQAVVSLALPPIKDEANLVNQIDSLATKSGLTTQNITLNASGNKQVGTSRNTEASSSIIQPVGLISTQATFTGNYSGIKSFLSLLETNLRIMDITSFVITPVGKSNQDFYNLSINFDSYYQNTSK